VQTKSESVRVIGKLDFPADHPFIEHFKFIQANTKVTPKITIPAPPVLHFRGGRKSVSEAAYPSMDEFFDDLGKTYRKAVKAFYDAGCRYLQFDDTVWAYLCSPEQLQKAKERGEDIARLPQTYADVINYALAEKPADMKITTHVCRGNFRSTWISEGGYEPVAELLFGGVNYDGYFLEYDTTAPAASSRCVSCQRATSRSSSASSPQSRARWKSRTTSSGASTRRQIVPLEQLCLSPQCGFASTEEGNILAEDEQWAKLSMVVKIADEVWGKN
jgi:5-methyltetrahydropteroyltriglutamate--homocysteine methyltransferase